MGLSLGYSTRSLPFRLDPFSGGGSALHNMVMFLVRRLGHKSSAFAVRRHPCHPDKSLPPAKFHLENEMKRLRSAGTHGLTTAGGID